MKIQLNNVTNPKHEGPHRIVAQIKIGDFVQPIVFERTLQDWRPQLEITVAGYPAMKGHDAGPHEMEVFNNLSQMAWKAEHADNDARRTRAEKFFPVLFSEK